MQTASCYLLIITCLATCPAVNAMNSPLFDYIFETCPTLALLAQQGSQLSPQAACQTCQFVFSTLTPNLNQPTTDAIFAVAPVFLGQKCASLFTSFKSELIDVILPIATKAPDQLCALLLSNPGCLQDPASAAEPPWTVQLPNKTANSDMLPPASNGPYLKILHLTDIHLDLLYQEGSVANCQEPICCQNDSTPTPGVPVIPAAKFGSYSKCDSPMVLLNDFLGAIKRRHGSTISAVYVTGDYSAHDQYKATRESRIHATTVVTQLLKDTFGDVKVFMTLGNHEGVPVDSFPPVEIIPADSANGNEWLYSTIANLWVNETGWLPNDTYADIYQGGFYTALLKPGWRVIALNDMFCDTANLWLYLYNKDPFGELAWLVNWLQYAEANGERVHILGHIPTADQASCRKVWSANYYAIVSRFRNTIAGQFFGHEHNAYFSVFYDVETLTQPVSVSYVTPSVTPYYLEFPSGVNPTYYIWTVDSKTMELMDYSQFFVNLQLANRKNNLLVQKLMSSAKQTFGLKDLSPQSWHDLAGRMQTDDKLFLSYWGLGFSNAPNLTACGAGTDCKMETLCFFYSARTQDPTLCAKWLKSYKK